MLKWLVLGAAASLAWASAAGAEMKGLTPPEIAGVARTRALDLRIAQETQVPAGSPIAGGMLVSQELSSNAAIGIGFAGLYGRKKSGSDVRITGGPRHSHRPAIKFVMHF